MNKTFSYLEAQYSKNLKEFRETELKRALEEHEMTLLDTVEELETKYERKLREQEDKHQTQVMAASKLFFPQAAQSYPVLLITLYLYINSILKIIRKSCVINLLRYIFI